jgi:hypothetical protein
VGLELLRNCVAPVMLGVVALWIVLRPPQWLGSRARLYAILILGVPVAAALVQSGNTGFARYYLSSAIGLLLLASEWAARVLGSRGRIRATGIMLLAVLTFTALWRDWELIALQRGAPDGALALMQRRSPNGAQVALEPKRLEGELTVAASRAGYAIHIAQGCGPADYVFAAQSRSAPSSAAIEHCGIPMRAIGSAVSPSLSGEAWVLYGAESLQTTGVPVSGPAPAASDRRTSGRAGVAQG